MIRKLIIGAALAAAALAVSAANAADVPSRPIYKAPPASVQPPWDGFYVGAHAGYADSSAQDVSALPGFLTGVGIPYSGSFDAKGLAWGGVVGANKQFGQIVVGIEADVTTGDFGSSNGFTIPIGPGIPISTSHDIEYFGTVRGRLGWAPNSAFLIYGTAGLAWAKADSTIGIPAIGGFPGASLKADANHVGWAYGAGVEWNFLGGLSLDVSWIRHDFRNADYGYQISAVFPPASGVGVSLRHSLDVDVVRAALKARF